MMADRDDQVRTLGFNRRRGREKIQNQRRTAEAHEATEQAGTTASDEAGTGVAWPR